MKDRTRGLGMDFFIYRYTKEIFEEKHTYAYLNNIAPISLLLTEKL